MNLNLLLQDSVLLRLNDQFRDPEFQACIKSLSPVLRRKKRRQNENLGDRRAVLDFDEASLEKG